MYTQIEGKGAPGNSGTSKSKRVNKQFKECPNLSRFTIESSFIDGVRRKDMWEAITRKYTTPTPAIRTSDKYVVVQARSSI